MSEVGHMDRPSRGLTVYAWVFIAVLYGPVLLIPVFSFNESIYVAFPIKVLTLQWYRELLDNGPMWDALWNSVQVGGRFQS